MGKFVQRFVKDESGATAIEYGLIAALVAVVLVTALGLMGNKLAGTFNTVTSDLPYFAMWGPTRCASLNCRCVCAGGRSLSQPIAGENVTTVSALPREASSNASHPPSELPARCAFSWPASSSTRSRSSATSFIGSLAPSGAGAPP